MEKKLKRIFACVLALALVFLVSAGDVIFRSGNLDVSDNLAVDTNTLYVDSANNNVGIGTTSAQGAKLRVSGGPLAIDNGGGNLVTGQGSISTGYWIRNKDNTDFVNLLGLDGANNMLVGSAGVSGVMMFKAGGEERMRINQDGTTRFYGNVRAPGFTTGDIVFSKEDGKESKPVWRMFEDENGLYVESLTTGKKYKLVLQEI